MNRVSIIRIGAAAGAAAGVAALLAGSSLASSGTPTLNIAVTPTTVRVSGAMSSGATEVVANVAGEKKDVPLLFRLNPGVSVAEVEAAANATSAYATLDALEPYGRFVFGIGVFKGAASRGEIALAPGTYAVGENGPGQEVFTVTAAAHPAPLPAPDATITAIDFGFRGTGRLHDGELVRFRNEGYLIHSFFIAQARNLADAEKLAALVRKEAPTNSLVRPYVTGVKAQFGPLSPGAGQDEIIDQPPGVYVMADLLNAEDGRLYTQLGMVRIFRIAR